MKQNYFLLATLLLTISLAHSQSIKIKNVKYSGGSSISNGTIEIPDGGSVKIDFTVEYNTGGIDYGGSANIGIMFPNSSMITSILGTMTISPRYWDSRTFSNKTLSSSNYPDGSTLIAEMNIPSYGITKSNKIPIKIKPKPIKPIDHNDIRDNQSVGQGVTPKKLLGSTPTGGNGQYEYQWQHFNSGRWQNITINSKGKDYRPPVLTKTTKYRRIVNSGDAKKSISNEVTIRFISINNTIYGDKTVFYREHFEITGNNASGGDGDPTYKWQRKEESQWIDIFNRGSSNPINLHLYPRATYKYRRLAIFENVTGASNTVTITVKPKYVIENNYISGDQTININERPSVITGSTPQGGSGTYSYQWRELKGRGARDIEGATSKNYQPPSYSEAQTIQYKRFVYSKNSDRSQSNIITITVVPNSQKTNVDLISKPIAETTDINTSFQVYPNPSNNGRIQLQYTANDNIVSDNAKVIIYSGTSGKKMFDKDVKIVNSEVQTEINIPQYRSNDIYVIKLLVDDKTLTKRVLVK
ncbi:T9SS type A sorting domain-containing protein [Sinomicrobium weinanense]|uniref:T9SS type A sorting domain-containing protein n=1 Tax=Sinomicrobium weinanense TaxID=2842200 RepID=A0A926Q2E4_9FLAO|nr:T9SS type A sorting domain-containing protein [Sinomicrobium weinanense]MBC9796567.1 T9SS type A sorting domain-containing protein [Sinomicrobium weinanense]MBU3123046.1 T9SS type A sorting domain-containing protein [Sinomicrobium weinanense]